MLMNERRNTYGGTGEEYFPSNHFSTSYKSRRAHFQGGYSDYKDASYSDWHQKNGWSMKPKGHGYRPFFAHNCIQDAESDRETVQFVKKSQNAKQLDEPVSTEDSSVGRSESNESDRLHTGRIEDFKISVEGEVIDGTRCDGTKNNHRYAAGSLFAAPEANQLALPEF